jgi:FKBP-type peptidyl-prolyl cis-trans isomerase SlyD
MKMRVALVVCVLGAGLAGPGVLPSSAQPASGIVTPRKGRVADGVVVRLEYTMRNDAGALLAESTSEEPLVFTQGEHQIIPGLERAVAGMEVGDEKRVAVPPEEAYGAVDPGAETEVPRSMIPPEAQGAGPELVARSPDGATRVVRVKEVRESTVVLDLNHPLAGMTLHFAVRILGIDEPSRP